MPPDEKDRLGDTLHRKQKADEERYFAEREKEVLAKREKDSWLSRLLGIE